MRLYRYTSMRAWEADGTYRGLRNGEPLSRLVLFLLPRDHLLLLVLLLKTTQTANQHRGDNTQAENHQRGDNTLAAKQHRGDNKSSQ